MKTSKHFVQAAFVVWLFLSLPSAVVMCFFEEGIGITIEGLTLSDYPKVLPAGYCLITNGESYGFRRPVYRSDAYGKIVYRDLGGDASEEESIRWAWYMKELPMRARNREKTKIAPYRPANPELCKDAL